MCRERSTRQGISSKYEKLKDSSPQDSGKRLPMSSCGAVYGRLTGKGQSSKYEQLKDCCQIKMKKKYLLPAGGEKSQMYNKTRMLPQKTIKCFCVLSSGQRHFENRLFWCIVSQPRENGDLSRLVAMIDNGIFTRSCSFFSRTAPRAFTPSFNLHGAPHGK